MLAFFSLFLGVAARPAGAHAEDDSASLAVSAAPSLQLTRSQLEGFAALVGDSPAVVAQRLTKDPGLVPFAIAAAAVRSERKSSGKVMTAVGFSILGVGTVGGLAFAIVSGPCSGASSGDGSESCSSHATRAVVGLSIALVSQGVGLALGIPGIVRMAKESDVETEAAKRYGSARTDRASALSDAGRERGRSAATSLMLPLLSAVF
jgi:hypothetical protein